MQSKHEEVNQSQLGTRDGLGNVHYGYSLIAMTKNNGSNRTRTSVGRLEHAR